MSFSSEIKEKLCNVEHKCMSCTVCEIAGALMFGGSVSDTGIRFSTENEIVAERVKSDIKTSFGIDTVIQSVSKIQKIIIENTFEIENIAGGISQADDIPFACCRASFVRGAFLGGGSVTDPQKSYHIEFDTKDAIQAEKLKENLEREGFSPKITDRKGYSVVYIKGSEEIADLLGYMGATQGAFELFSVQVEREMRNDINRRVNCENANTNKAAIASSKHLYAIKKIKDAGRWNDLPDVLKEIAILREEYPEDSLKELGQKTNPTIGKSGVNHRLSRLIAVADELK